jgi:Pectinacetylesterase
MVRTMSRPLPLAIAIVVSAALSACGGSSTSTSLPATTIVAPAATTTVTTVAPATTTTVAPTTTTAAATLTWEQVKPGGGCMCSDASEFSYFVRKANPAKVLFFMQGGGACFDVKGCGPGSTTFTRTVTETAAKVTNGKGIFDIANPKNPFADYSMVYVPYCTGDVHLGNLKKDYGDGVVIEHKGSVNARAALAGMAKMFPDATNVVISGASAGAVPAPLYAGEAADSYPKAKITVFADGAGGYPDVPGLNKFILTDTWGGYDSVPKWPTHADLTPETLSFPGLFVLSGKHSPAITFARHDYAFDKTQVFFAGLAGLNASELIKLIDQNESQVEAKGVKVASYIAPGDSHTVVGGAGFYTETVNGVLLVDWVTGLVTGKPTEDVHCTTCT